MTPVVLGRIAAAASFTEVTIDVERLVESRLLMQASSGGGKSWAIRRLLEVTFGHVQHIVIDVEDEFFTLREKFDYALAGRHTGDCPANVRSAPLLARRLLELEVSAVVGIYELPPHERIAFVKLFLNALINAPRNLWHPVLVVIDEAQIFCPQNGSADSAAAVIDLMTRGRKRGLCGVLATQRISKLHKDAAAEAKNKMIGSCNLDLDVKRGAEELGLDSRAKHGQKHVLRGLDAGHFFVYGPAVGIRPTNRAHGAGELTKDVCRIIVGEVSTTHPRVGQRAAAQPPPREKVRAVLAQLADLPKEAEEQERSVVALEATVKDLKRQLSVANRAQPTPTVMPGPVDTAELQRVATNAHARGHAEGAAAALQHAQIQVNTYLHDLESRVDHVRALLSPPQLQPLAPPKPNGKAKALSELSRLAATHAVLAQPTPTTETETDDEWLKRYGQNERARREFLENGITGPGQRILDALAWLEAIDVHEPELAAVAALADYSASSSGFEKARGALRTGGLVSYPRAGVTVLTDAGRAAARPPESTPTAEALQARVLGVLDGPGQKLLRALLGVYPGTMSRDTLAAETDYSDKSSGFEKALGRLRTLGLVEYPERGTARARDILFPEGS